MSGVYSDKKNYENKYSTPIYEMLSAFIILNALIVYFVSYIISKMGYEFYFNESLRN